MDENVDINDFKWSSKYPYYKTSFIWWTIAALLLSCIFLLNVSDSSLSQIKSWVIIIIGLGGLWIVYDNLYRLYIREEILIEDNFFVVKHNNIIKKKVSIDDIFFHESIYWWKWNYEASITLQDKTNNKQVYNYNTKYLQENDVEILSNMLKEKVNNDK